MQIRAATAEDDAQQLTDLINKGSSSAHLNVCMHECIYLCPIAFRLAGSFTTEVMSRYGLL